MKILLVYPKYPDTYWGFKHALKFVSKRSANIPLGILTVASMLPGDWKKRFTDLNVSKLDDQDIVWADYVFISATSIQTESVNQIIKKCKAFNTKIVAGGPLFTEEFEQYSNIEHLILNEAEITLPAFINDLELGQPKNIYQTKLFADITKTPIPDYPLADISKYATAGIQYSRGCPYDCEFCDITALFGRKVRTKSSEQIIAELDQLFEIGWKGSVFFVDDNFIGHKKKLKNELLPAMINWMELHSYPFIFMTEATINMADDVELMDMMVRAGFNKVFIGIETPEESCLAECNKKHNNNRNLIGSVQAIQQHGIEVTAGFIVGFDNDPPNIFQRQIDFIQQSGIITAMVGLLNAPRLSKLYKRLSGEGRILNKFSGDNTDYSMNFIPAMDKDELIVGYKKIIHDIYSGKFYYKRTLGFLKHYNPPFMEKLTFNRLMAFFKSVLLIGILKKDRKYYWNLILWSLFNKPKIFPLAVTYSIYGYHFRKVFGNIN
ncbi:MAG: B12-binding domain-containing radical SAM protein [Bacteroidales bacterium]|nr:B12-binding domain-containing radical SAM protein [Bacteroidales bacterium]